MEQPQEQAVPLPTVAPETEAPGEEEVAPTKSVKNFWERLDEVFNQNTQLRERMEELVEQFPEFQRTQGPFKSYLYQPERILISSNDDVTPILGISEGVLGIAIYSTPATSFNSFRVRLKRPLLNVKSIQLLSATIPNAIQNIPDNSTYFFYYKLRNLTNSLLGGWNPGIYDCGDIVDDGGGQYYVYTLNEAAPDVDPTVTYWNQVGPDPDAPEWDATTLYAVTDIVVYLNKYYECVVPLVGVVPGQTYWLPINLPPDLTAPNYYDLARESALQFVNLYPTTVLMDQLPNELLLNRTFQNPTPYEDLLESLNTCATVATNASIPNDAVFLYSERLNKFQFAAQIGTNGDYFMPAGFLDPLVNNYLQGLADARIGGVDWKQQYTMNLRLGFTWNGVIPNVFAQDNYTTDTVANAVYNYLRPKDPRYPNPLFSDQVTAESYGDLVNTSCVRIYMDCVLGSTQDSNNTDEDSAEGLLSLIPINATNLGVGFYQNNFNNELTKIPGIITELGVRLVNDQGLPFNLPNSATVLLELAIDYSS